MDKTMNIDGVECYEKDGIAYLKLDTVARGLGFTEVKNGKDYIMWRRVDGFLKDLGFGTSAERPNFIPENIFYRLAMKAKNETAERFQAKVADEIIPSIRKTGMYKAAVSKTESHNTIFDFVNEVIRQQGGTAFFPERWI